LKNDLTSKTPPTPTSKTPPIPTPKTPLTLPTPLSSSLLASGAYVEPKSCSMNAQSPATQVLEDTTIGDSSCDETPARPAERLYPDIPRSITLSPIINSSPVKLLGTQDVSEEGKQHI
jgi:hypothetical protein